MFQYIIKKIHEVLPFAKRRHSTSCHCKGEARDKFHPRTDHESPEGEQMYSSTLPSTLALNGGWVVNATPRPLYPHCVGCWVGLRAGLDGCAKSCPYRDWIPQTVQSVVMSLFAFVKFHVLMCCGVEVYPMACLNLSNLLFRTCFRRIKTLPLWQTTEFFNFFANFS